MFFENHHKNQSFMHKALDWLLSNIVSLIWGVTVIFFIIAVIQNIDYQKEFPIVWGFYVVVCTILNLSKDDLVLTNVAAIAVAVSIIAGVIQVYIRQIGFKVDGLKARLQKKHAIVCGSGDEAVSAALVLSNIQKVIVLGDDTIDFGNVSKLRKAGIIVFIGKGDDDKSLHICQVSQADVLLAFRPDYAQNIMLCKTALRQINAQSALKCLCNVPDINLKHDLVTSDFFNTDDLNKVKFVNQIELTARHMIDEFPPDAKIATHDDVKVRIVLIGLGSIGQSVLFDLAQLGHYRGGHRPVVKVIDKNARQQYQRLIKRTQGLDILLDIELIETDINDLSDSQFDTFFGHSFLPSVVYICTKNEICNVVAAKKIYCACEKAQLIDAYKIVLVDPPGGKLIHEFNHKNKNIHVVPLFSNNSQPYADAHLDTKRLFEYATDKIAEQIHQAYKANYPDKDIPDWSDLPEYMRDANRYPAAHIEIKLRAIGCRSVPLDNQAPDFQFTEQQLDILQRMEHARWSAEKTIAGYSLGPRNDKLRLHNCLVDFDQLSEQDKNKDRESIENIPNLLKSINYMISADYENLS